jgi:L-aspartate oxidase
MTGGPKPKRIAADFLIVGGGIAGYQTALDLLPLGSVALASRGSISSGSSYYAQGGLAIPWGFDRDAIDSHVEDTIRAGAGLCDEERVRLLIEDAEEAFATLVSYGVPFDRNEKGEILFTREAAHSRPRIVHAGGDKTGSLILKTLAQNVHGHERFTFLTPYRLTRLLKGRDGRVAGGLFMDETGEEWLEIVAKATIMATGGFSALFARTTNPPSQVGDAAAVCHRAGAELERLAFTQFHPTVLDLPGEAPFLLTEALRGEGGHVVNEAGERILFRYHPDGELAPRDVVSRALWLEARAHPESALYLSVTHLPALYLKERFPQVFNHCLSVGIDLSRDRAPIRPAAHFQMGGIKSDMEGRTSLPGLYAVGEVASTRVHGANRLASNSLLEALVMGHRVVHGIVSDRIGHGALGLVSEEERDVPRVIPTLPPGQVTMKMVQNILWEKAGIVRFLSLVQSGREEIRGYLSRMREGPVTTEGVLLWNALELSREIFDDLLVAPRVGANFFLDESPENAGSPVREIEKG